MKKTLVLILLSISAPFFGQTDEIVKHNGEKTEVNFIKTENSIIYYSLPGNFEEKKISKYAVALLNSKSKKSSQIITEKIQISTKSDSKKIIVLKPSETFGLEKADIINLFPALTKGQTAQLAKELAEKRLKEKAAAKGYPFIVIEANNQNELKATAYKY
ncbi:hypothetical protein [Flavobacterium luteum]|uniref:Uncharacterized protein n=1 Tax=Flavobacterium luteum TaxID=2026654 RepID=A0A7J5ABP2_9FLAO|nr:hypothetical protein [Flavobacterium luteum]KAB1154976.1 hypothetical protein F6464_11165 [Flavobacterium luteum]